MFLPINIQYRPDEKNIFLYESVFFLNTTEPVRESDSYLAVYFYTLN